MSFSIGSPIGTKPLSLTVSEIFNVKFNAVVDAVDDIRSNLSLKLLDFDFDCVDHDLLLQRLHLGFGLSGVVLEWIRSFLQGRTQPSVLYNGQASKVQQLSFGVP